MDGKLDKQEKKLLPEVLIVQKTNITQLFVTILISSDKNS